MDEPHQSPDGTEEVPVLFYFSEEVRHVPIATIRAAAEVTSTEVLAGSAGVAVEVDDGFFTMYIEPDGQGTGFDVTLRAGNAVVDTARLDSSNFVENR